MPKTRRSPQLVTRLSAADMQKFREVAYARDTTQSGLVREAILYYLEHWEKQKVTDIEGIYAQQLKTVLNRLEEQQRARTERECKLLAKIGIDIHSVYQFLAKVDDGAGDLMRECTGIAAKRLSRAMGTEEQVVASGMASHVTQAG